MGALDARELEQIVDQRLHGPSGLLDALHEVLALLAQDLAVVLPDQAREAQQRHERRAEVVGHGAERVLELGVLPLQCGDRVRARGRSGMRDARELLALRRPDPLEGQGHLDRRIATSAEPDGFEHGRLVRGERHLQPPRVLGARQHVGEGAIHERRSRLAEQPLGRRVHAAYVAPDVEGDRCLRRAFQHPSEEVQGVLGRSGLRRRGVACFVPKHRHDRARLAPEGQPRRGDAYRAASGLGEHLGLAVLQPTLGGQLLPQLLAHPAAREEIVPATHRVGVEPLFQRSTQPDDATVRADQRHASV